MDIVIFYQLTNIILFYFSIKVNPQSINLPEKLVYQQNMVKWGWGCDI